MIEVDGSFADIRFETMSERWIGSFYLLLDSICKERKYLLMLEAPSLAEAEEFIRNNMARKTPCLLAIRENEVIGWCDIIPRAQEGFRHCGQLGMGIHVNYRHRGLGRKLVEAVLGLSLESGIERVELEVFASNTSAIALYEKLGFVHEGRKVRARKLGDEYDDVILMGMILK